jgi:hypothetical protein
VEWERGDGFCELSIEWEDGVNRYLLQQITELQGRVEDLQFSVLLLLGLIAFLFIFGSAHRYDR